MFMVSPFKLISLTMGLTFGLACFSFPQKKFRTFITLKSYHLSQSGNSLPQHKVQLKLKLSDNEVLAIPHRDLSWTVSQGSMHPIDQTFEIPPGILSNDGFTFEVEMLREGKKIEPCRFTVTQISQYDRNYICRSDVNHQIHKQNLPDNKISKEAVQIRVFTSLRAKKKDIPRQVITLK